MILKIKTRATKWRGRMAAAGLLLATGMASAEVQQAWVARYNNGITNGQHEALKMQIGSDGDIYVCGFSQDANSNLDYVTVKYGPNGKQLWAARFGSSNKVQAKPAGFALDSSNNVVVTGNAGTVKYDAEGSQLWAAEYDGLGVTCDSGGNVIVTGYGTNFNTIKLSPAGSNVWEKTYTDVGPTISEAVAVDAEDDVYISGSDTSSCIGGDCYAQLTVIKYNSNGVELWKASHFEVYIADVQVPGMVVGSDGDLYILANLLYNLPYCTFKYSSGGTLVWAQYNPTMNDYSLGYDIASGSLGNVATTGNNAYHYYPNASYGTYLIQENGMYVWTNTYPEPPTAVSAGLSVAMDITGNVYVTGYSPGATSSNDIVTIAYDTKGKQLWLERYDGPGHGDDEGNAIAVDAQGNVYVAGYDTPVGGGTEMVLIKYAPVTGKHEANGSFQLEAQGAANEPFDVRASTNLADWLDLGTYGADTNGVLLFTDTNAGLFPQRFYVAKPE